jgi:hypothetical protein
MARDRSNRVIALVTVCVFSAALIPQSSSAGGGGSAVSPSASIVGDSSSSVSEMCTLCSAEALSSLAPTKRHPCIAHTHPPIFQATARNAHTQPLPSHLGQATPAMPTLTRGVASRHETILTSTPTHPPPSLFPRPSARQHCKPAHVSLGRHLACLHWPYLSC